MLDQPFFGFKVGLSCKLKLERSVHSLKDPVKDNVFNGEEGREGYF